MQRWHSEVALMRRRAKVALADRGEFCPEGHPRDCGRPRCGACHGEKCYAPKRRGAECRRAIRFDLDSEVRGGVALAPRPATPPLRGAPSGCQARPLEV